MKTMKVVCVLILFVCMPAVSFSGVLDDVDSPVTARFSYTFSVIAHAADVWIPEQPPVIKIEIFDMSNNKPLLIGGGDIIAPEATRRFNFEFLQPLKTVMVRATYNGQIQSRILDHPQSANTVTFEFRPVMPPEKLSVVS